MKKMFVNVILAVLVVMVSIGIALLMRQHKTRAMAKAEVGAIVQRVHETQRIGSDLSPNLREVIKADPAFVLICLVTEEARRGWPGISSEDAERITNNAVTHSEIAICDLQRVLRENAKKAIADAGHDPEKSNWDDNNCATALLYCYWPKAEQKGKQAQFVEEYLCGNRDCWTSWMFNN